MLSTVNGKVWISAHKMMQVMHPHETLQYPIIYCSYVLVCTQEVYNWYQIKKLEIVLL